MISRFFSQFWSRVCVVHVWFRRFSHVWSHVSIFFYFWSFSCCFISGLAMSLVSCLFFVFFISGPAFHYHFSSRRFSHFWSRALFCLSIPVLRFFSALVSPLPSFLARIRTTKKINCGKTDALCSLTEMSLWMVDTFAPDHQCSSHGIRLFIRRKINRFIK